MKYLVIAFTIGLAGCHSAPSPSALPPSTKAAPRIYPLPAPAVLLPAPAASGLDQKIRQQAQYIEALISQNDALTMKLAAAGKASSPTPTVVALTSESAPLPPPPPLPLPPSPSPSEPMLTPNADNIIDLVAFVAAEKSGEPVNPFSVRTVPPESVREVTLHVGGIVAGPMACAIINDRLVQVGEIVESLAVERIETDGVLLRHSGRLLKLPVSEKSTRVRLPL